MHVTSFYSYKGGVGRTVCLLNVAWELALRGKRVALMDLDLEAPGLHRAHLKRVPTKGTNEKTPAWAPVGNTDGLLHAFTKWTERIDGTAPGTEPLTIPLVTGLGPGEGMALLAAGRKDERLDGEPDDEEYRTKVASFSWSSFYKDPYYGRVFLERIVADLAEDYDHLLIDARTGVTDVQYVTTIHLPDLVVLVTNLTDQSLRGTREQCDAIESANRDCVSEEGSPHRRESLEHTPIETLLVASPVPLGEWKLREERLAVAHRLLGRDVDFIVDHLPILAYQEEDQVLEQTRRAPWSAKRSRNDVASTFSAIADAILRRSPSSAENLLEAGERILRSGRWRESAAFFDAAMDIEKAQGSLTATRAALGRIHAQIQGLDAQAVRRDLERLRGKVPEDSLAQAWLAIAWSELLNGKLDASAEAAAKAADVIEVPKDDSGAFDVQALRDRQDLFRLKAFAWYAQADALASLGQLSRSIRQLELGEEIYRYLPGVHAEHATSLAQMATVLAWRGEPANAESKLQEAEARLAQVFPKARDASRSGTTRTDAKRLRANLDVARAEILFTQGDLTEAAKAWRGLISVLEKVDPVGTLLARTRLLVLMSRYGGQKLETEDIGKMEANIEKAALDLRMPECAATVRFNKAVRSPSATSEKERDRYRRWIISARAALIAGRSPPALADMSDPEHHELRYEVALLLGLAARMCSDAEGTMRARATTAYHSATANGIRLWAELLGQALDLPLPERPPEGLTRGAIRELLLLDAPGALVLRDETRYLAS